MWPHVVTGDKTAKVGRGKADEVAGDRVPHSHPTDGLKDPGLKEVLLS